MQRTNPLRAIAIYCFAVALAASFALLRGCSQGTTGTSNNDKYEVFQNDDGKFVPQPLDVASSKTGSEVTITSSGWWAKDSYIHYGIKVLNPNGDLIARDVVIQISSYDEAGTLLSQDTDTISFIGPHVETGFAGTCGNGQKPASVTIEILGTTVWQDASGYVDPLFVTSVDEADKGYYRYEYTGGVTNNTGTYVSTAPICILLEDEDGNILAGYAGSTKRIKTDRTKDYQITINTAPEHAQVEVFAHWSTLNDNVNEQLDGGEDA
ncbi:MAG: hypothetical protein IJH83_01475 [Coriobacteriales bacterium]|nr:hypothetical protein [Coriobacteriales bacterium]